MSGAVNVEDYAVILIWLAICSVYTTLLTITALGVILVLLVFILYYKPI